MYTIIPHHLTLQYMPVYYNCSCKRIECITILVGGFKPSENMFNWDDDIPNVWKNQNSCSKPQTRYLMKM